MQRNIAHVLCFLTWLPDPQVSVVVFYDMLRGKLLHVYESQTGKGSENKNITDYGDSLQRKLLVVDSQQFVHG